MNKIITAAEPFLELSNTNASVGTLLRAAFSAQAVGLPFYSRIQVESATEVPEFVKLMEAAGYMLTSSYIVHNGDEFLFRKKFDPSLAIVLLHVDTSPNCFTISLAASEQRFLYEAMGTVVTMLPPIPIRDDGMVPVRFWAMGQKGPLSYRRNIFAPKWDDVFQNYPMQARGSLQGLIELKPPLSSGSLALFRGEPGTGKTYFIRSLIRAWRRWCDVDYLVDPEKFFERAEYMLSVILEECQEPSPTSVKTSDGQAPSPLRWRLLVMEDADEFITMDAKQRVGQGFARLLNLTEGFVGQGLNLIVLLTTNVSGEKFHHAVIRSGRCFANVEFPKFGDEESVGWFRAKGLYAPIGDGSSTLSELYDVARRSQPRHA